MGGPGALIVGADNAVVLEQAGVFTSVQGPGFPQLRPFEAVYDIIDLAPKSYHHPVVAMSREGILLDWDVEVQYQIADGGLPPAEGAFYSFSAEDVFRASTAKCIREKGWRYGQDMDWEGLLVLWRAESALRSIVARRPLDHLIGLTEGAAEVAKLAIQSELEEDLRKYAPTIGAKVLRVRLDNLQVRDEVAKQWIETWQARWQSWSAEKLGYGEAKNIYQYEEVKAEAQAKMIADIAQELRDLEKEHILPQAVPQMVLMRLFSVLDRADFAASSRVFFPMQTLNALEAIQGPVKGGFHSNVTTVVANPSSIPVTGSTTILATLRDGANNPVPDGTEVVFSTTAGSLSPQTARTVNSVAQTTLTAGNVAGKAQVSAQAASSTASTTVRFLPGPASKVSLVVSPSRIEVGGQVELFVEATDAHHNPVPDGTLALFQSTLGIVSPSAVDTKQGRAQSRLTANGKAGQAEVSVQVGQQSDKQQVVFLAGAPDNLVLTADPQDVPVRHQAQVEVTVLDSWGNPVAGGRLVTFHAAGGSISPSSSSTTVEGKVSAIFTAGPSPGPAGITASCLKASESIKLNVIPGLPEVLNLAAGEASIEVGASTELTVIVQDAGGNPVADGTEVSYEVTGGTVWPPVAPTKTGRAAALLTAAGRPGRVTVTASAGSARQAIAVDVVPGRPRAGEATRGSAVG
jgi:hypothetical protein